MCFIIPNRSVPVTTATPSRSAQGSVYTILDIETYTNEQDNQTKSYAALGAADKSVASTGEEVSIKGMVNVPVATDFSESKKSINELTAQRGDLASIPNIDICAFMGDTPSFDFDLPNLKLGDLPSLNEIMAGINGITLPSLEFASDAILGVIGKLNSAVNDISAAIQGSIPTISCGKPQGTVDVPSVPQMGDALKFDTASPIDPFIAEPVPYGTNPNIILESPDVTVKSLDDIIDAGVF